MIVFKIQGGLGNQLFQWAYSYALSKKIDQEIIYDIGFFFNQDSDSRLCHRNFLLPSIAGIEVPILDLKANERFMAKPFRYVKDTWGHQEFQYDHDFSYYFDGFWQSEKYFASEGEGSLKALIGRGLLSPWKRKEVTQALPIEPDSCSLHVRRTDFLTTNGHHPLQPPEYYKKALEKINFNGNIYIFSDDIEWCKENLNFDKMHFIEGNDPLTDLWLMSQCSHNIMVNSSFSWWGAWLNPNPSKIVVYPQRWLGDQTNTSDICPQEWIAIQ